MLISVIVPTYNRPDALAAVLEGYLVQTDRSFDVIVADDGSRDETKKLVMSYKKRARFPLSHVWQEDQGYRLAAIRNRAISISEASYIIFTDGDCIPLPDFVIQHRRLAESGWFLVGKRILLNETFTSRILRDHIAVHNWKMDQWMMARIQGEINRWLPFLSLPGGASMRKLWANKWEGAMTCNLSAWREDLLRINGMDENFTGWGKEDSDLVIRLLYSGVRRKSARFAVPPVLHLWHKENDRSSLAENRRRLDDVLKSDRIRAIRGLSQYLENPECEP
jgi:glycosyltransferase involved in cell wall biosynthesis